MSTLIVIAIVLWVVLAVGLVLIFTVNREDPFYMSEEKCRCVRCHNTFPIYETVKVFNTRNDSNHEANCRVCRACVLDAELGIEEE